MKRAVALLRRFAGRTPGRAAFERLGLGLLALWLITSAGVVPATQVAAASPASDRVTKRFHLDVGMSDTLCVGETKPIVATMLVDVQSSNGRNAGQDTVVPGIKLTAESKDTSVATVKPPAKSTGVLPNNLNSSPSIDKAQGLGQVTFSLTGVKAGIARVLMGAEIPPQWAGSAYLVGPIELGAQVINCKYQITIAGQYNFSAPNLVSHLTEIELKGIMTRDDFGHLSGAADVTWKLTSQSFMCGHAHKADPDKADLSGDQVADSDTLNVTVTYHPFALTSANCGGTQHGNLQEPALVLNHVSVAAGSLGKPQPLPVGNEAMKGNVNVTIIVLPGSS